MLPKAIPRGKHSGGVMETSKREASFSYDRGTIRRGRREHWRPIATEPVEAPALRRRDAANLESIEVFSTDPAILGTDAA